MNKKYKARIARAVQYIESNLANKISLADVASVSHFSDYHFHRIFTGMVGETVNDYIVRRRLECAANLLIFRTELSVTQIALENGFSSTANFSKAIKRHFGFSPSEIRNPDKIKNSKIGKISSKYGKEFSPLDLYPARITNEVMNYNIKDTKMNVEVRELDCLRVCTLASERGYELDAIYSAWDRLIDWATNHGIQQDEQKRFALAFDNPTVTPIDKCRYTASIVIGDEVSVQSPFISSEIPKGKYAVLYYKGAPEDAIQAQLSLYSNWLPESGFEPDDFPMMERYLNDVRADGYLEMEIHVKLKVL
ncbi:AraC family transcriptional regulator [Marinomonas atlantica]|uniref:AraC family transcriptional regulator n=1 Tax=Marinomonas atlantica TaxID=1806668 RepID=UPI000835A073|nr:GyrI-like domain-containing protein [Marinomonas atlantica]